MNLNVIYRAQLQIVALYFFKIDFKNRERSSARNLNADKRHCPLKEAAGAKKTHSSHRPTQKITDMPNQR